MAANNFSSSDVSMCICANLRRVTRKVVQMYDGALRPAGLTSAQFNMIAVLKFRPDLSITDLAKALGVDRTTLTRNLNPLLTKGYINSGTQKDDRVRTTRLTERGLAKFEECYPLWEKAQRRLSQSLGTKNVPPLLGQLDGVLTKVDEIGI